MEVFSIGYYSAKSSAKRNALSQLKKASIELNGRGIEISSNAEGAYYWANEAAFNGEPKDELLRVSAMKGACALVWDIAEAMLATDPKVKRGAILESCVANGIAYYTARTQYQLYRQAALNS